MFAFISITVFILTVCMAVVFGSKQCLQSCQRNLATLGTGGVNLTMKCPDQRKYFTDPQKPCSDTPKAAGIDISTIETFRVDKAFISYIPYESCSMTNVKELFLTHNIMENISFSEAVRTNTCLANLVLFDMQYNLIKLLDFFDIIPFRRLKTLNLDHNKIVTVLTSSPKASGNFQLQDLYLRNNLITTIDISVVGVISLVNVYMDNNMIDRIENMLSWDVSREAEKIRAARRMKSVRMDVNTGYQFDMQVSMENNRFSEGFMHGRFWGVKLASRRLTRNSLQTALATLSKTFSFLKFNLKSSTVSCDCHVFRAWSILSANPDIIDGDAVLLRLWNSDCENARFLLGKRRLSDMRADDLYCQITADTGCPVGCSCSEFPNGKIVVNCENAELSEIPHNLPRTSLSTTPVYDIRLANNNISVLPVELLLKRNIKSIDLTNNSMIINQNSSRFLFNRASNVTINLRGNRLVYLSAEFLRSRQSRNLILKNMTLVCSCDNVFDRNLRFLFELGVCAPPLRMCTFNSTSYTFFEFGEHFCPNIRRRATVVAVTDVGVERRIVILASIIVLVVVLMIVLIATLYVKCIRSVKVPPKSQRRRASSRQRRSDDVDMRYYQYTSRYDDQPRSLLAHNDYDAETIPPDMVPEAHWSLPPDDVYSVAHTTPSTTDHHHHHHHHHVWDGGVPYGGMVVPNNSGAIASLPPLEGPREQHQSNSLPYLPTTSQAATKLTAKERQKLLQALSNGRSPSAHQHHRRRSNRLSHVVEERLSFSDSDANDSVDLGPATASSENVTSYSADHNAPNDRPLLPRGDQQCRHAESDRPVRSTGYHPHNRAGSAAIGAASPPPLPPPRNHRSRSLPHNALQPPNSHRRR